MNVLKKLMFGLMSLLCLVPASAREIIPQQTLGAFKNASPSKLDDLAKRFELKDDWRGYVCHDFNASMLRSSSTSVSLILVKSPDCQLSFLLPFWRRGTSWSYNGTIELNNSEGSEPVVSTMQLVVDESPAIVIKDNSVASGTGLNQKNLQIFMLVDGKSKLVFNEPYQLFLRTQLSGGGAYTQSRESEFKFSGNLAQGPIVTEIRKSSVDGNSLVEHYNYGWNPRLKVLTLQATSP